VNTTVNSNFQKVLLPVNLSCL